MTNDGKPIYCWDASVFLAWINDEADAPLADIAQIVDEIDKNQAVMVVPVTIASEVLRAKMTQAQAEKFDAFLKRSNVILAATTFAIAPKGGRSSRRWPCRKTGSKDQDSRRHDHRHRDHLSMRRSSFARRSRRRSAQTEWQPDRRSLAD